MTPKIAICVGHSRLVNGHPEGGAVSVGNVSEWTYNRDLSNLIAASLDDLGIDSVIITEYAGHGYGAAQRWLAGALRTIGATAAIELHFNSSDDPAANGHEWLHWHSSAGGKRLAEALNRSMTADIPDLRARGLKPKSPGDRGAEFLRGTHCPAVIVETGFGSSPHDWNILVQQKPAIAHSIAVGIADFLR